MNTQYTIADLMKEHRTRAIARMEQQALKDIEQYILHAIATAESRLYDGVFVYRYWKDPNWIEVQFLDIPYEQTYEGLFCDIFEMDMRIANKDEYIMFIGDALKNMGFNVVMHHINFDYHYDGIEIKLK